LTSIFHLRCHADQVMRCGENGCGAEGLPVFLIEVPAVIVRRSEPGHDEGAFSHTILLSIGRSAEVQFPASPMNQPVAIPADRLQILRPVGPAVRPERAVMDLQPITAAAVDTPPPVPVEYPVAMQPVNRVHQPNQGHSLAPVFSFDDENVSGKGSEPEAASVVWNRPYVVARQYLCLSPGHP
jgi:hypothetical protein